MGVECVSVPSRATHLMFLPVLGSRESEPTGRNKTSLCLSARNVGLPEHPELVPLQNLFGHFVVLHAQAQNGFPLRMGDKGVKIVDVELSFEKRRHEPVQLRGGIDLNGQQLTL